MKFALIFAAVTLATTSVVDAAPANVPIWQDILMHDCTGGSHFMPSSPFGVSFDTSVQESIYNQFFLEILERLGCSATSTTTPSTATDVTTRYLPSVDMIMAHIFGQDSHPSGLADGGKKQNFYDSWLPMVRRLDQCINSDNNGMINANVDVSGFLGDAIKCNAVDYLAGKPCFLKMNTKAMLSVDFGITLQKCPGQVDGNAFASISCLGEACAHLGKSCSASTDCGSDSGCLIIPVEPSMIDDALTQILSGMGMQSASETALKAASALSECMMDVADASLSLPWKMVNRGLNIWNSFFNAESKASTGMKLGVCVPKDLEGDISQVGEKFSAKVEAWTKNNLGETTFDRRAITSVKACKAKGCGVGLVANGICDTACNNAECDFDGGDCIADTGMKTERALPNSHPTGTQNIAWSAYIRYPKTSFAESTVDSTFYRYEFVDYVGNGGVCVASFASGRKESIGIVADGCLAFKTSASCSTGCEWITRDADEACSETAANVNSGALASKTKTILATKAVSTKGLNPICGNGRCESFKAFVCVLPYCDPKVQYGSTYLPGVGMDQEDFAGIGIYTHDISELTTCPQDCNGGEKKCAGTDDTVTLLNGNDKQVIGESCGDDEQREEIYIQSTSQTVVVAWDGKLTSGIMSNSASRVFGKYWTAPSESLFRSEDDGVVMFRTTCRGAGGFNLGNGLRFGMSTPKGFIFLKEVFRLVFDYQKCRAAVSSISGFDLTKFRDNWELWHPIQVAMKRLDSTAGAVDYGNDPLENGPYNFLKSIDEMGTQIKQLVPTMPKSCSYKSYSGGYVTADEDGYQQPASCRMEFKKLGTIFKETNAVGEESMLFEMKRCKSSQIGEGEYEKAVNGGTTNDFKEDGLPAMSFVMIGNSVSVTSPIALCDTIGVQSTCADGLKCMDMNTVGGFNGADFKLSDQLQWRFKTTKVIRDTKNAVTTEPEEGVTAAKFVRESYLNDAVGIFPYGFQQRSSCSATIPTANMRLARNIILRGQNSPADNKADMKMCVPAMLVDAAGSATVLGSTLSERSNVLMTELSANPTAAIAALTTEKSATLYGIEGKIEYAGQSVGGKSLFKIKPEKGKLFQKFKAKFKGENAQKFKTSACGLRQGIGKMQINMLKGQNYAEWKNLKAHHIIVDCQENGNFMTIYIQVKKEGGGSTARADIKAAYEKNEFADAVLQLTIAGVDTENQPEAEEKATAEAAASGGRRLVAPTTDELETPEIDPNLLEEITVEGDGLDADTLEIMRDEGLAPEEGEDALPGQLPMALLIFLVILGVCCCCGMIAALAYIVMNMFKKRPNNDSKQKKTPPVDIVNPVGSQKPIEVQAVPVM